MSIVATFQLFFIVSDPIPSSSMDAHALTCINLGGFACIPKYVCLLVTCRFISQWIEGTKTECSYHVAIFICFPTLQIYYRCYGSAATSYNQLLISSTCHALIIPLGRSFNICHSTAFKMCFSNGVLLTLSFYMF